MHTSAIRVLSPTAFAARASRCARQGFHSSLSSRLDGHGNGGKPADESVVQCDDNTEPQAMTDTVGGRSRNYASGSLRNRHARKRPASALPPVQLPTNFLDNNVSLYTKGQQPRLPIALVEDAKHDKRSGLYGDIGPISQQIHQTVESYFETALSDLLLRDCELAMDFLRSKTDTVENSRWNSPEPIERVVRIWDMILDSAWHLTDALYPARFPEYIYKTRPFWWWHWHKDLDPRTLKFRDQFLSLKISLDDQFNYAERLDYPLPHALADLPVDTFVGMQRSLQHELNASAPPGFDTKTNKRPITVLSISGYGGKAISEALGENIAFWNQADLVRLDAYDLSVLVGEYLGQNWAYSRGALSMMGFKAAELNGRLAHDPEALSRLNDNDDGDTDAGLMGFRTASTSLEDELEKIKDGGYECFSKWENLKIDKILDEIIGAPSLKSASARSRPLLLQVHDLVELSMTLEGSLLLTRLRTLVDAAWQRGVKIAILGTSSSEQPSEEYQNAVRDLAVGDLVLTRHLQPDRADKLSGPKGSRPVFDLQKADYFAENIANINRMLRAMDPSSPYTTLDMSSTAVSTYLRSTNSRFSILRDSILPIPEVYHLASSVRALEKEHEGCGPAAFMERFTMGPLRQKPGQKFLNDAPSEDTSSTGESSKNGDEAKAEGRGALKLNEYEKRISSGQINRENLRTTFQDIHAPQETVSALKLLTSLALLRPDAFSYGVLAGDKIPGCLLYGPPGTGKTMLAKAVAKESGANMLEISGATINDKWVGESEKLIRAVFTLAKKLSPCVVFIDEADSLLANRSMFSSRASHREHINQFLKEWDGMEETNAFIMVATNRPFDLDDAVLRRLPRKILVDLPTRDDRAAILRLSLKGEELESSVSLDEYASRTSHYSGSDLKNVCVAAAMAAVEEENAAATVHSGPEPFQYPAKRILRNHHFERALRQIPASISEDMVSLKLIRKFDEDYGNRKKGAKKSMGFGIVDDKRVAEASETLIRPGNL